MHILRNLDLDINHEKGEPEEREDGEMVSEYDEEDQDEMGGDTDRSLTRRNLKRQAHRNHRRERNRSSPPLPRDRLAASRQRQELVQDGDDNRGEEEDYRDQEDEEDERGVKRARYANQRGREHNRSFTSAASESHRLRTGRSVSGSEYTGGRSRPLRQCRTPTPPPRKRSLRRPSPVNASAQRTSASLRQYSASREPRFSRPPYRAAPLSRLIYLCL